MDHRRTFESPMDWEYQDSGPMDPSSPFARSAKQSQQKLKSMLVEAAYCLETLKRHLDLT